MSSHSVSIEDKVSSLRECSYPTYPPPNRAKNTTNPPMSAPLENFDEDGFGSFCGTADFKLVVVVVVVVVGDADGASVPVGLEVGLEVGPDDGLDVGTELGTREGISDG
jgi:hypothetical protein